MSKKIPYFKRYFGNYFWIQKITFIMLVLSLVLYSKITVMGGIFKSQTEKNIF